MARRQNQPINLEPPNLKTLLFGPGTEGRNPRFAQFWSVPYQTLRRFSPFRVKLCSTKPKPVPSLQNRTQTSKPRTPKPQTLKGGTQDLHRFSPFHIKLCSTKPKTVATRNFRPGKHLIKGHGGTKRAAPDLAQNVSISQ